MIQTFNIEFVNKRCFQCNIFWCIEKNAESSWICPRCGRKEIADMGREYDRLLNVIRGLRSALKTKTRNKKS